MKRYDLLRKMDNPISKEKRSSLSLMDIKEGSFIKLRDTVYYVEQVSKYLETKWEN